MARGLRFSPAKPRKVSKGAEVMEKTYSQKIAGIFEIICYVLLVPTILSLIYPVFFMIGGGLQGSAEIFLFGFVPFLIVAPGIVLLVGYCKHSRGRLKEKNIPALWLGTAIYNLALLLPWLFFVSTSLNDIRFSYPESDSLIIMCRPLVIVFGYLTAIIASLKAYSFEKRKKVL
jgi:hypothetical protein